MKHTGNQTGFAHLTLIGIVAGAIVLVGLIGWQVHRVSSKHNQTATKQTAKTDTKLFDSHVSQTIKSTPNSSSPSTPSSSSSSSSTTGSHATTTNNSSSTSTPPATPAAPTVSIDVPTNNATIDMNTTGTFIHFVCTHSEPAGYNGMKYTITGPNNTDLMGTKSASDNICNDGMYATDSSDMPDGLYTLTIIVYDTLGRSATASTNFYIQW